MTSAQPIIDDGVHADYAPDLYRYDTEAQQVACFADIGPEQLAFFHQQGYLVITEAFSPAQVADAGDAVYDLIDGKQPEFRGVQLETSAQGQKLTGAARRKAVRKLMKFVDWDERFQPLATDPESLGCPRPPDGRHARSIPRDGPAQAAYGPRKALAPRLRILQLSLGHHHHRRLDRPRPRRRE